MHSLFPSFHFCLCKIFHVEAAKSAIKQNYIYAELYPVITYDDTAKTSLD